jgi:hypothetical protein
MMIIHVAIIMSAPDRGAELMRYRCHALVLAACAAIAAPGPAGAWDYPGHRVVGAIADLVLQQHEPEAQRRVSELLAIKDAGGMVQTRSLREVAVFPDCAKSGNEPYCGRPPSDEERAYVERNPHHAGYHYTDVPLQQPKYVAGAAGTEDNDVVQMIGYAIAQLRGASPTKTGVQLTDAEAVWLLAHMVGDIHQPLHVGAMFFDRDCEMSVDPNVVGEGLPKFGIGDTVATTVGGNLISLAAPAPAVPPSSNLHLYWDGAAVLQAMEAAGVAHGEQDFARQLAMTPPYGWQTAGPVETWATQWATEVLPLAAEAHGRLTIRKSARPAPFKGCTWETTLDPVYQTFAAQHARIQISKAGFRLAAVLRAIFAP